MLNAFYDLAVSPVKYDVMGFIMAAEYHRSLIGENGIRFIIVPGPNHGFRLDKLPPQSIEKRYKLLENVVLPMFQMVDNTEIEICANRIQAEPKDEIFPTEYLVDQPTAHYGTHIFTRLFAKGFYPFRAYKPTEAQPDLVTITLRECEYWPTRNSNRDVWIKAAEKLKSAGFRVLFIPDTDGQPVDGFENDIEASTNLHRRAALYESAKHNYFVSNGPAWMAAAMPKVNATVFKIAHDEGGLSCSTKYWTRIGFPPGSQIGRENHRLVWADDTEENVMPVIDELIGTCGVMAA